MEIFMISSAHMSDWLDKISIRPDSGWQTKQHFFSSAESKKNRFSRRMKRWSSPETGRNYNWRMCVCTDRPAPNWNVCLLFGFLMFVLQSQKIARLPASKPRRITWSSMISGHGGGTKIKLRRRWINAVWLGHKRDWFETHDWPRASKNCPRVEIICLRKGRFAQMHDCPQKLKWNIYLSNIVSFGWALCYLQIKTLVGVSDPCPWSRSAWAGTFSSTWTAKELQGTCVGWTRVSRTVGLTRSCFTKNTKHNHSQSQIGFWTKVEQL